MFPTSVPKRFAFEMGCSNEIILFTRITQQHHLPIPPPPYGGVVDRDQLPKIFSWDSLKSLDIHKSNLFQSLTPMEMDVEWCQL